MAAFSTGRFVILQDHGSPVLICNRWHADIKPENIIYVRGKYKLADPGFACFKKVQDKSVAPQISLHGGTDTYGAPEASQAGAHQTIDTWSLGCVFSMAATWVVLGYQGICQYHLVRQKALSNLLKNIEGGNHPLLASQRLRTGAKPGKLDCFHDGIDVLSEVTGWHALLKNSCRKSDPITAEVIQLIDDHMLLQDPTKRLKSKLLCEKLQRMVDLAKKTLREVTANDSAEARAEREHVEDLLKQVEKDAATQHNEKPAPATRPFEAGLPVNRSALKVQMDYLPLKKTSHRFETIPEPRSRPFGRDILVDLPPINTSNTMDHTMSTHNPLNPPEFDVTPSTEKRKSIRSSTISRLSRRPTFGQPSRSSTATSNVTRRNTGIEPRNWVAQNVIQAREHIERERERKRAPLGLTLPKRKLQKDGFLSTHFIDRDIVSFLSSTIFGSRLTSSIEVSR